MYPQEPGEVPEETARRARAANPKGTRALRLRDVLGTLYHDEQCVTLSPTKGPPAYAPWRLALVTVLHSLENLTDRQAANAVRERIEWTDLLGLEREDPGVESSVRSAFRTRLVEESAETLVLDRLLEVCKERGWLKAGGKQRTASTHVLARVRSLSKLECVGETVRAARNDLADLAPAWVVRQVSPDWCDRSSHRVENDRWPKRESQRTALATRIGADGLHLLAALEHPAAPAEGKALETVQILRQVCKPSDEVSAGQAKWRAGPRTEGEEGVIRSPDDPQAQTDKKWETTWLGDKGHLTETCDPSDDRLHPPVIVQVQTTVAPVADAEMTTGIHEELEPAGYQPAEHLVATGDVDADILADSSQRGIRLPGPTMPDTSWQAQAGKGVDLAHVSIDWPKQQATCPAGQVSARMSPKGPNLEIVVAPETCALCPVRAACTHSQTSGRMLTVRPQAAHEALQAQRALERTPAFRQQDAVRAGLEATHSQAVRAMGLRRSRYDGLANTHVQHVLTAVALNLARSDAVLTHRPRGHTRRSSLARLASRPVLPAQRGA